MENDKIKNKMQLKYSGKLMRHWYWCVVVVLLLLVLTAVVLYVNTLAGVIFGGFTILLFLRTTRRPLHRVVPKSPFDRDKVLPPKWPGRIPS